MRLCRLCGIPFTAERLKHNECNLCHYMRNGTNLKDFKQMCNRICLYQLLRDVSKDAIFIINTISRNGAHPLCKHSKFSKNCVALNPSWPKFKYRMKKMGGDLSRETWRELCTSPCEYCGYPQGMGIDRVNPDIGYTNRNSVSACMYCNLLKRDIPYNIFMEQICTIHERVSMK